MLATMGKHLAYFFALTWLGWTTVTDAYHQEPPMKVEPELNCDFESDMCSWTDISLGNNKWGTRNAFLHRYTYGPKRDHTYGSADGYFLRWLTYRYGAGTAVISSPSIITDNKTCLSFWYFTTGHQHGTIQVHKVGERHDITELLSIYGPQGSRWYRAEVNTGHGMFRIDITAKNTREQYSGDIAVDDITFSYQDCQESESELLNDRPRLDCDFEDDLCSWSTDIFEDMYWRRIQAGPAYVRLDNVLPPRSNGTSYAILTRHPTSSGDKSDLRGPTLSVDSHEACMSFWYKLEGEMASSLFVTKVDHWHDNLNSRDQTLFSAIQKSHRWTQGFVTLPEGKSFHIVISGKSRVRRHGMIALDDIRMTRGAPCPKVNQEELISCDFERDLCLWYLKKERDEGDEGDWLRHKGSTPTNATGPSHDHTSGDGSYIFLDASKVGKAKLYSAVFTVESSGACLSFWYYLHGDDVYRLQLAYQTHRDDAEVNIWSLEGSQEDRWVQQNVSLNSKEDAYLTFTAERNYFPRGDIALDDISIDFGGLCGNDTSDERNTTIISSTGVPEDTTVTAMTYVTPFWTEPTPMATPHLIVVKGEINPAYNNSRVELRCQHPQADPWRNWYMRKRGEYSFSRPKKLGSRYQISLVFDEIQMEDAGFYTCELATFSGLISEVSNEVEIKVVPDPMPSPLLELEVDGLDIRNTYVDLQVNSVLKLTCGRAVKDGVYIWKTTSYAFSDSSLPSTRFLIINSTRSEHTGVYSCRISKDKFMTDKSNQFYLSIKPGKRCKSYHQCTGTAYRFDCRDKRCTCSANAVVQGRECKMRPQPPTIVTSPGFREFGIGESFYLICKAGAPVPSTLTYSFSQNSATAVDSLRIMKITNATEEDSGKYTCSITHDNIQSRPSNWIYVEVKEFVNLNCDFGKGFCGWFQQDDINSAKLVIVAVTTSVEKDSGIEHNGPYIQLGASNSKDPKRAMLLSPTIGRTSLNSCLTFWYRMHGPDVHGLSVWQRSKDAMLNNEYAGTEKWAAVGESGSHWMKQSVTIGKGQKFQIAFEAIGQVDIDDIVFTYRGGC